MGSCKKEIRELASEQEETILSESEEATTPCRDELEPDGYTDSISTPTILGNQLMGNPYSVEVMQEAFNNLYGEGGPLEANKKYVRFRPEEEEQLQQLQESELALFDYPLDREVVEEGDYYPQPGIGENEIPWFYAVVDMDYDPPAGILYEELAELYVPDNDLLLEDEALRITGNSVNDTCNDIAYRPPVPCEIDPCSVGCPIENCGSGGGGGGTNPNPRKPSGRILVWDSNLDQNVAVRQVRVVARRWFKTELMYTDDQGRFVSGKRFRNKVNILVKFFNNNLRLTRLFGSPYNALMPLKKGIGIYSGNLNNIEFIFERGDSPEERRYRYWWAAQMMNAYQEFNEMASANGISQLGPLPFSNTLRVALTRWSYFSGGGATPMNSHRVFAGTNFGDYIKYYFVDPVSGPGNSFKALLYDALLNGVLFRYLDMGLGYRTATLWASNRVKDLMYHELAHASHFNGAGASFWTEVVYAEAYTLGANGYTGPNAPYGDGNDGGISDIISVAESWAEHVAQVFCDVRYNGVPSTKSTIHRDYFNDDPVFGLSSHLNAIEDFSPNRVNDPFRWIPEGIYYDMIDERNDNDFDPILPIDNADGYTNQQFFSALGGDIRSMFQFRVRLSVQNGNDPQVLNLFLEYGY